MPSTPSNSINESTTGVVSFTGTSFTASPITQHDVLVAGASNAINSVAPSATSGVPLISQGAASDPAFGTAVVAGGGTGLATLTAHALYVGNGTSAPNALAVGSTGQVLQGNTGADPSWGTAATGDVTAASNLTDNAVIRGDGGAKGVQTSTVLISDAGQMTNPSQPAFSATASGQTNVTGDGTVYTILWATERFDQGNNFASNTFTAPVTGKYFLSSKCEIGGITSGMTVGNYVVVTSNLSYGQTLDPAKVFDPNTNASYAATTLADMDAADTSTVTVAFSNGTKDADINNGYFSGYLAC